MKRLAAIVSWVVLSVGLVGAPPAAAEVFTGEYRFGASVNDRWIAPYTTEIWAKVHRPTFVGATRYPLIVMMHGNHQSCGKAVPGAPRQDDNDTYAADGTCPAPYTPVKSHEGFNYLASDLASRGYIVVSINAHRGFPTGGRGDANDQMQLRARGNLALWHLKLLSDWSRGVGPTPTTVGVNFLNRIDFNQVGLMGHSRGAAGMRSALQTFREAPAGGWKAQIPTLAVRGLLEIAPPYPLMSFDDPNIKIADPFAVNFASITGMCDADVLPIEAGKQFDRLIQNGGSEGGAYFKALYGIYGANHNYFNSQWQQNDARYGCTNQTPLFTGAASETGSSSQRSSALTAVRNFFRSTVGSAKDTTLARTFDPAYAAPAGPRIDRAFSASPTYANSTRLEEFNGPDGINSNWVQNNAVGLSYYGHNWGGISRDHDYRSGLVQWTTASANKYLQTNWSNQPAGWNLSSAKYLEFRVAGNMTEGSPVEFTVQLVNANNTRSAALVSTTYVTLPAMPGTRTGVPGDGFPTYSHSIMPTVRIPLTAFTGATLSQVRGARFTFNRTSNGSLSIGSVVAAYL